MIETTKVIEKAKNLEYQYLKTVDKVQELSSKLDTVSKELETRKKADAVLEALIKKMHATSIEFLEQIVTRGLVSIFEQPLQFKIKTLTKRGNLAYEMVLMENGQERSIIESFGGGVVSVISVLLRIITILIVKPQMQRVLFLDESLAQLSRQYVPNAAKFFKELGKELGFKILMVTHDPSFAEYADNVYEIRKDGMYAEIKEISDGK